jgi:GNAT superfamily N-acetyltransferase
MKKDSIVKIERLTEFKPEDTVEIGQLFPSLSEHLEDSPVNEELLRDIINSPYHVQIVARDEDGKIIGAATMSVVFSTATGRIAYLEDLVVNKNAQGSGIGKKLWDEIIKWSRENNLGRIEFTSSFNRKSAHTFYKKLGAKARNSAPFRLEL